MLISKRPAYALTSLKPTTGERLIKVQEAAYLISVSVTQVWRLVEQGHLKTYPITEKRVGFDYEEVIIFIRRRKETRQPIILMSDEEWKLKKAA